MYITLVGINDRTTDVRRDLVFVCIVKLVIEKENIQLCVWHCILLSSKLVCDLLPCYGNPRGQYQKSYLDVHEESSMSVLNLDATGFGAMNRFSPLLTSMFVSHCRRWKQLLTSAIVSHHLVTLADAHISSQRLLLASVSYQYRQS